MDMENLQKSFGNRKFYDITIPSFIHKPVFKSQNNERGDGADDSCKPEAENIIHFISHDLIGDDSFFIGPFGIRKIVYCDHIASSRALHSFETYIKEYILPNYGNVHTTTSVTSLQSSMFQQEAR